MRLKRKKGLGSSKKGNAVSDTMAVLIIIIVFVVCSILTFTVFTDIKDVFTGADTWLNNDSQQIITDQYNDYPDIYDAAIITAFFLLWIGGIVASFLIDAHPVFYVISFLIIIAVIIGAIFLYNGFDEYLQDDSLTSLSANFPMTAFLLDHLIGAVFAVAVSILIVLFGKSRLS